MWQVYQGPHSDLSVVGLCVVLQSSLLPGQKIKCLWALKKWWGYSPPAPQVARSMYTWYRLRNIFLHVRLQLSLSYKEFTLRLGY